MREVCRKGVDDGDDLALILDADVDVDPPDHHVAAPPLSPLDQGVVAGLVGHFLLVPLRERVAACGEQFDAGGIRGRAHGRDRVGDVVDRVRHRIADAAGDLDGVGEQLTRHRMAFVGALVLECRQQLRGATDEITAHRVGEHDLPFEAYGGPGR